MNITVFVIPLVIAITLIVCLVKKVDILKEFRVGALEGLETVKNLLPTLIIFLTVVTMLRSSGALDFFVSLAAKPLSLLGIPKEVLPLSLIKPFSGSGSIAFLEDIFKNYGPDSFVGRVASVICGSTETSFYTIAVYFGAVKVSKMRHTAVSALSADLVAFVLSAIFVRLLL